MRKRKTPRLTAGEMEILEMLWEAGEVSLSQAQQAMKRDVGYTTIQTRLNRMVEKGLVRRSRTRPAKYSAAVTAADVSAGQLDQLLKRVSGGSVVPLVAHLVRDRALSAKEIDELKSLIDQAAKNQAAKSSRGETT